MNIIGKSVKHITFGEGVIVNQYDDKIEIDFGSNIKSFLYPAAFEKFVRMVDKNAERAINKELEQLKEAKKKVEQEKQILLYRVATKTSHGVFDLREEELSQFLSSGEISISREKTKKTNTMNPQGLNMDSACILTMKENGMKESERKIVGICMVRDDFIGEYFINDILPTLEKYRIMLTKSEPIYFWNMFPKEKRKENWGSKKMKCVSTTIVESILSRIFVMVEEDELKTQLIAFEEYFSERNVV